jgi:putative spermidine/putrescine transport system permease protein
MRRSPSLGLVLTTPALAMIAVAFLVPILHGVWLSFHEARFGVVQPDLTIKQYVSIFNNQAYLNALVRTLKLATMATLIALIIGYVVAYALAFKVKRFFGVFMIVLIAPLLMNVVVRTMGWVLILGRNGLINTWLTSLGFDEVKLIYTEFAVLLGYVQVFLPFMVLSILASLQTIDLNLLKASQSLGSTPFNTFRTVLLPLSLPGILSGCVIVFSLSSGVFIIPAMLGGVGVQVFSLIAYRQTVSSLNYPLGSAIAFVLLAIVLSTVFIVTRFVERGRYKEVFNRAAR